MRLLLIATMAMLLAPLAGAKSVEPATAAWDDATGDVRFAWAPPGAEGTALPALAEAMDIVNVALGGEDDEGFDVVLTLAEIDAQQDQLSRHFADVNYAIGFDLTESPFRYTIHLSYSPLGHWDWDWEKSATPVVEPAVYGYLTAAVIEEDEEGEHDAMPRHGEGVAHLKAMADFDANTITVRVPRAALERAGPGEPTIGPLEGDELTNLNAMSHAWWPAPAADLAPDEGFAEASFPFAQPTANAVLRLSVPVPKDEDHEEHETPDEDAAPAKDERPAPTPYEAVHAPPIAVNLGAPTQLLLTLENRGGADAVAQLTARAESEATGFAVRVADAAVVAAGQTVLVNLVATLDQAVEHRARGMAIVEAAAADGSLARVAVPLIASAGPTTQASVLQLHSAPHTSENPLMEAVHNVDTWQEVWLNALPADPLADDAPVRVAGPLDMELGGGRISIFGWGHGAYAGMDTPLARPLALVEGAPILLDVGLRSSQSESGTLHAALYQGDQLVGEGMTEGALSGDTVLTVELAPEATAFPFEHPSEGLHLWLAWEAAPVVPEVAGLRMTASAGRELWLLPADTRITLPLDEAAEQAVGPMVVIPEPTEEQAQLDSEALRSRDVPGLGAAALLAGLAAVAVGSRRRR